MVQAFSKDILSASIEYKLSCCNGHGEICVRIHQLITSGHQLSVLDCHGAEAFGTHEAKAFSTHVAKAFDSHEAKAFDT